MQLNAKPRRQLNLRAEALRLEARSCSCKYICVQSILHSGYNSSCVTKVFLRLNSNLSSPVSCSYTSANPSDSDFPRLFHPSPPITRPTHLHYHSHLHSHHYCSYISPSCPFLYLSFFPPQTPHYSQRSSPFLSLDVSSAEVNCHPPNPLAPNSYPHDASNVREDDVLANENDAPLGERDDDDDVL